MGKISWTVSADSELVERLKALAEKEERSQAYFLDKALRLFLERREAESARQLSLPMGGSGKRARAKVAKKSRK